MNWTASHLLRPSRRAPWLVGAFALVACGDDSPVDDTGTSGATSSGVGSPTAGPSTDPSTDPDPDSTSGAGSSDSGDDPGPGLECETACDSGEILWQVTWGDAVAWESPWRVSVDAAGRIAVAGISYPPDTWPPSDSFLALFEPDGTRIQDLAIDEHVSGATHDVDGTLVVSGETDAGDLWLRRYDGDGGMLWDQVYPYGTSAYGGSMVILANGEIVIGGGTNTAGLLARFGSDGDPLEFSPTQENFYLVAVAELGEDVVGVGEGVGGTYWAGRLDAEGTAVWSTTGPTSGVHALTVLPDGRVLAAITNLSQTTDMMTFDPDGTLLASEALPRAGVEIYDMLVLDDGDLVMAGAENVSGSHCWLGRLDADNTLVWEISFAEAGGQSQCRTVDLAPDGSLVASGGRRPTDFELDAWLVKLAP